MVKKTIEKRFPNFSPESFNESKAFWLQLIIGLLVIQGAILAYTFNGFDNLVAHTSGTVDDKVDFYIQQGILMDINGNAVDENNNMIGGGTLSTFQNKVKQYYDTKIQNSTDSYYLFFLLLLVSVIGLYFTVHGAILFFVNLETPTTLRIEQMFNKLAAAGLFIPSSLVMAIVMDFLFKLKLDPVLSIIVSLIIGVALGVALLILHSIQEKKNHELQAELVKPPAKPIKKITRQKAK